MTFKGMLKILINDYRKQQEEKMFSIAQELLKTRHELRQVQDQLHTLQLDDNAPLPNDCQSPVPTISLFVQYNGFFNKLCDIRQTMTVEELLVNLRQLTGIPAHRPIRLHVLSEDGLTALFSLHQELHRTIESYLDRLKPRMILSIDDSDDNNRRKEPLGRAKSMSSERIYSFDQSDV